MGATEATTPSIQISIVPNSSCGETELLRDGSLYMKQWPTIREGLITAWHGVLDYDQKIPTWKRDMVTSKRALYKSERLKVDFRRTEKAAVRAAVKAEMAAERRERNQMETAIIVPDVMPPTIRAERQVSIRQIPSIPRGLGYCPACGSGMRKGSRATDSGSGCLILIVGLVLTPVLCGIPLILIGLHYMSKREGFWQCPGCGMQTGRKVGFFEFSM